MGGEPDLSLDCGDTADKPTFQVGLHRLRRKVHRKVELVSRASGMSNVRHAFRNKRALSHACFGEATSSSFGVCPRHRCEVDAKRFCQGAVRR
jgi:hypothetical protein